MNNLLALAVLSYLTQRPMHAYELNRMLKDHDAARTFKLSYGALYGVVRQMDAAGFIRAAGTGQSGKLPKHTMYELTDLGRAEMRDWLQELISEPRHEYPAFAAALSLVAVLPPDTVVSLLRDRVGSLAAETAAIRDQLDAAVAKGVSALFLVEDDYRIALLEAESAFIKTFIVRIEDPEAGLFEPWAAYHAGQAVPNTTIGDDASGPGDEEGPTT
ncbi:helix-turn-helix transcriptional regulator [Actinopolymorpha rutila]|uniref:DNA-binding PadR family transcriptional regulator n=1 Tax=Actinopolymorpha rutila TaxID=446787 RepID=A0A852ZJK2_9ACTN|nr:DNA-binding PadR family transcriptional regulator [Actinopolymorpha rutila]